MHSIPSIQFLHSRFVAHGNIQPHNILVDRRRADNRNLIKVCSYGLSTIVDESTMSVGADARPYVAPEVLPNIDWQNKSVVYDVYKADMWSTGVVVCEM